MFKYIFVIRQVLALPVLQYPPSLFHPIIASIFSQHLNLNYLLSHSFLWFGMVGRPCLYVMLIVFIMLCCLLFLFYFYLNIAWLFSFVYIYNIQCVDSIEFPGRKLSTSSGTCLITQNVVVLHGFNLHII